jgi:hypothetical protein
MKKLIRRKRVYLTGGGFMELNECKFYLAGEDMNFAVYSDDLCRAKYLESIRLLPIGNLKVHVYEVEPGAHSEWVAVTQREGRRSCLKIFVRKGERFLENQTRELPQDLKKKIVERFPKLISESRPGSAGQTSGPLNFDFQKQVDQSNLPTA